MDIIFHMMLADGHDISGKFQLVLLAQAQL